MPLSNEMKLCIACAEEIKAEAQLCKHCNTKQDQKKFLPRRSLSTQDLLAKYGAIRNWLFLRDAVVMSKTFRYVVALTIALYLVAKISADLLLDAQFVKEERGYGVLFTHESFFILSISATLAVVALLLSRPNLVIVLASTALIGYLSDLQYNISLWRFSWTRDPLYLLAQLQSEGFSSEYVVSDVLFWVSQTLFPLALALLLVGFFKVRKLPQLKTSKRI